MYLSFKDICFIILKSLTLYLILVGLFSLFCFNYSLGVNYCEIMDIPRDLALTVFSPGIAIEIAILLSFFELLLALLCCE